jgi:hypothetical protein
MLHIEKPRPVPKKISHVNMPADLGASADLRLARLLCAVTYNRDFDLGDLDNDLEKFSRSGGTRWSKYHVCIVCGYGDTWV